MKGYNKDAFAFFFFAFFLQQWHTREQGRVSRKWKGTTPRQKRPIIWLKRSITWQKRPTNRDAGRLACFFVFVFDFLFFCSCWTETLGDLLSGCRRRLCNMAPMSRPLSSTPSYHAWHPCMERWGGYEKKKNAGAVQKRPIYTEKEAYSCRKRSL